MVFSPAPEYQVFPTRERPLKPYEAAVLAARVDARVRARPSRPTSPSRTSSRAAPALAAELEGVPVATLIPHVLPGPPAGLPAVLDRRAAAAHPASGRALWKQTDRLVAVGLEQGRGEYNDCRARLGLAAAARTCTPGSRAR